MWWFNCLIQLYSHLWRQARRLNNQVWRHFSPRYWFQLKNCFFLFFLQRYYWCWWTQCYVGSIYSFWTFAWTIWLVKNISASNWIVSLKSVVCWWPFNFGSVFRFLTSCPWPSVNLLWSVWMVIWTCQRLKLPQTQNRQSSPIHPWPRKRRAKKSRRLKLLSSQLPQRPKLDNGQRRWIVVSAQLDNEKSPSMLFVGLKSGKIYSITINNISETFLTASNSDKSNTVTYTKWSKRSGHPASSCNPMMQRIEIYFTMISLLIKTNCQFWEWKMCSDERH